MRRNCTYVIWTLLVALCLTPAVTRGAARREPQPVGVLDQVDFDGVTLEYTYVTYSRCEAERHDALIRFDPEFKPYRGTKKVVSVTADIFDVAETCNNRKSMVSITQRVDLRQLVDDEMDKLIGKGYVIDPDYVIWLPAVRPSLAATVETPVITDEKETPVATPTPDKAAPPKAAASPSKVKVTITEYKAAWHCYLEKNDGARNDGFDGYGNTLEAARNNAAAACSVTNNSRCNEYSRHPDHTTCDVEFRASDEGRTVEYDSDNLPEGVAIDSWSCILRKNDGARKDGFSGSGATESEARRATISGCLRTNNPHCETYSLDNDHTKCYAVGHMKTGGNAQPRIEWTCTLWKNDGARKDGFEGRGATEDAARQDSVSGCLRTNNPNCQAYSRDPSHTPCTAEVSYE